MEVVLLMHATFRMARSLGRPGLSAALSLEQVSLVYTM